MIETKAFTVSPRQEQATIDVAANFGWSLKSSQEIKNKDSHLEQRGNTVYNVTESEHYVKLILERDTHMDNYSRIKELENTYYSIMDKMPDPPEHIGINKLIVVVGLILYVVPGVLYLAYKLKKRSDAKAAYEGAYSAWESLDLPKAEAAKAEARGLC